MDAEIKLHGRTCAFPGIFMDKALTKCHSQPTHYVANHAVLLGHARHTTSN